jgi:hypothetical protein
VTAKALVAQSRSRGFRLRVDDAGLLVAPRAALTEDDWTAIHEHLAELKALLKREADVAMVVAVFGPGVRLVSTGQPAAWPPVGGWLPSVVRPINVYAAEAPTAPCPCRGASDWHRAGGGWCCSTCHPDPQAPRADDLRGADRGHGAADHIELELHQVAPTAELEGAVMVHGLNLA